MRKQLQAVVGMMLAGMSLANAQTNTITGDTQINGATGSSATIPSLKITGDGGVLFGGTYGQGSFPSIGSGAEPRFLWFPKKAALMVNDSSGITESSVGDHSYALGGTATGDYSYAMGGYAGAAYARTIGQGQATGIGAIAIGGPETWSDGVGSVAIGDWPTFAAGDGAVVLGRGSAAGDFSFATSGGFAWGDKAAAIGEVEADTYASTVIGAYNYSYAGESPTTWEESESLFVIGNGEMDYSGEFPVILPSNALVMRKNANMRTGGSLETKGVIRCAPGGDLSMGTFTAGNNPATLNAGLLYSGE